MQEIIYIIGVLMLFGAVGCSGVDKIVGISWSDIPTAGTIFFLASILAVVSSIGMIIYGFIFLNWWAPAASIFIFVLIGRRFFVAPAANNIFLAPKATIRLTFFGFIISLIAIYTA